MARTKSNPKAAARRKAPIARSRTGSSGSEKAVSEKAVSENPSSSVNAGRTRGTKQHLIIGCCNGRRAQASGSLSRRPAGFPTPPGRR